MDETVATGWWCENCEFFESDDQVDTTEERCISCGCGPGMHRIASVVAKEAVL